MANTKASLTQQNTQTYPSNTSGSITALAVKSFNNNFINAVATLGDTNVFTEPQTFGDVVQVNSDVFANNVYAANVANLSGSNTFLGPVNTFSGSVNIQTASIQLLTVDTIISSSTINATGSNTLGDATNDTQTLWGQVLVKGGPLRVSGSAEVSGSLISVGGFTGSLQGTASWANNATTASHALTAVSSSYALNATSASQSLTSISASYATNAELLDGKDSSVFATTGSNTFTDNQVITNGKTLTIQGNSQARTFSTSSITTNGSNASFEIVGGAVSGSLTLRGNDTSVEGVIKLFGLGTGSRVQISGSTSISGSVTAPSFTGSLSGTSTNALTASSADNFEVRGELYANEINTVTSVVNASTRSIIINGGDNTITSASLSGIFNSTTSQILGKGIDDNFESNNNTIIGGKTSVISGSNQSTILGGSVRMNNVTASVALARDTAYTASANYTLFTQNIQSSGSVVVTGSLLVTDGITGSLQGTSSFANSASFASTASFLLGAIASASYAGNGFPFTGSAQISGALTITNDTDGVLLDFKQPSHTTESILSFRMGNQADVTQSISVGSNYLFSGSFNNTYRIVIPTTIDNLTGSLEGTASYAVQALSASWAPGGGGGMNLGANTFTGSQTIQSQSLFLQASSSIALNLNYFTASTGGATFGANTLMFVGSTQSGSVAFTGSRNVGTVASLNNAVVSTTRGGGNFNGNFGVLSGAYSTASSVPVFNNNVLLSGVTNNIPNTSSVTTLTTNFVGGAITVTGSALSAVNINQNNIDAVTIINDFTSSTGASQQVSISGNYIKGGATGGNVLAQIKFAGTGSGSNTRQFINNIMFGAANTASLEATGTALQNLLNTAVIGSNLIVSGTMNSNSLSGSMFVGQFNEQTATYAPADPSTVKFAVGTGTTNAARRTSFQVFNNGDVVVGAIGGGIQGRGHSVFTASAAAIVNATINAGTQVGIYNGSFVTNGGSIAGGNAAITTAIIAGEVNTISAGRSSATIASSYATINTTAGADSNNIIAGAFSSQISGSTSKYTGIYSSTGSFINEGINSAIIAANNARLNNTTGSVALGRDTAYTGSANYTLYTQNVNLSGSLTVNGNVQYNFGEFFSTASVTPSAGVSQSVVFDTTVDNNNVAISGSGALIKVTNAGTYNIQFSTQINTSAGADTLWMWFKKNGTNISNSASKVVLANNTAQLMTVNIIDTAAANDYYEIAYQTNSGNAQILAEAASGNIPAIPSVILTVTQVR